MKKEELIEKAHFKGKMRLGRSEHGDITHYFNEQMEELGQLCAVDNYTEPIIFDPPRKWGQKAIEALDFEPARNHKVRRQV